MRLKRRNVADSSTLNIDNHRPLIIITGLQDNLIMCRMLAENFLMKFPDTTELFIEITGRRRWARWRSWRCLVVWGRGMRCGVVGYIILEREWGAEDRDNASQKVSYLRRMPKVYVHFHGSLFQLFELFRIFLTIDPRPIDPSLQGVETGVNHSVREPFPLQLFYFIL